MFSKFKIKKKPVIAEIGINHNGSIKLAKKHSLAVKYNFDAVKFQKEI